MPVAAQESGVTQSGQGGEQIGSYTVGELTQMALVTSDGTEVGRVEAVIEGQDGLQVLANLEGRQVAIPLEDLSLSEDGEQLTLAMSTDELERMAAYEGDGQTRLGQDMEISQAMGGGEAGMDQGDSADMEEMETTVVEGTDEDVTVVTTAPSTVDTGETGETGTDGEQTEMAEGDAAQTGAQSGQMDGGQTDMAEGDAGQTGTQAGEMDGEQTDMAQGDAAQTGGGMSGAGGDISHFAEMTVGQILGMEVSGADGENVGEIDYIYQGSDGYMAVIGIGGFLGLGEHTVALPLSDFSMNETGDGLVVNGMTEADLDAMPEIDESELESLPDDHMISA
jgi:ribosomal 30S subunit maturation factor RimM